MRRQSQCSARTVPLSFRNRGRMALRRSVAVLALLLASLSSATTSSATFVSGFAFQGIATFPDGVPCSIVGCQGAFQGTARGEGIGAQPNAAFGCLKCSMTATFNYTEVTDPGCVANHGQVSLGTAIGPYSIDSANVHFSGTIAWSHLGPALVVQFRQSTQDGLNGVGVGTILFGSCDPIPSATLDGVIIREGTAL